MKRIVNTTETEFVSIDEINYESAVGIDWGESKTMVIQVEPNVYKGLHNSYCTPNLLHAWSEFTKQEYVKAALSQGKYVKAYVFDDPKALFKWMSE